jgi:hypothetical protein
MLKFVFALTVCFSLALSTGCAGTGKDIKQTGFLGDYPEFQPGPKGGADWVYLKEGVDFSVYKRIMIDKVVFFFKEDAKYKGIHPEELQELSSAFLLEMTMALRGAGAYPSAAEPAPDVLRIRFAITDVVQSKPKLQVFSALLPTDRPMSNLNKSKTGSHLGAGQASLEAELLDSMTNERIGAVIDTKAAGKFELTDDQTKWKHTKDAFKFWAQRLRIWLDEVHGK